ncbi:MAG: CPBP family intramembrane glutamic endopeptidase [Ardenticatenales bacterium]
MTGAPAIPFWLEQLLTFLLLISPGLAFVLAYLADDHDGRSLRPIVYIGLGLAGLGGMFLGGLLALTGALDLQSLPMGGADGTPSPAGSYSIVSVLPPLGVGTIVLAALSLVLMLPAVRRVIARILPIDAGRLVHLVALDCVVLVAWLSGAIALFMPIIAADPAGMKSLGDATAQSGLTGIWVQNAAFVVLAFVGVGVFVHRDWRSTLDRLGLAMPFRWRWWLGGAALALAVAVATDQLWTLFDPEGAAALGKLSDQLFGPLIAKGGLAAALTIGLAPGIGEELLFRGAAQPRFGLVFTSLLFAALHTQYTVSPALIQIFIVGLILGRVRQRAGTRTSILVHATFNALQVVLSLLGT